MRMIGLIVVAASLAGCAPSVADDKARLIEWRKLTIEQALRCDKPLLAMKDAMAKGDPVAGARQAALTVTECEAATSAIAAFGELPGKGLEPGGAVNSACGSDLFATAKAAKSTIALIDGDVRPSIRAEIGDQLAKRNRYQNACKADIDARAKSLGIKAAELEAVMATARAVAGAPQAN